MQSPALDWMTCMFWFGFAMVSQNPLEDPKSRAPGSGLQSFYGADYRKVWVSDWGLEYLTKKELHGIVQVSFARGPFSHY